ncbi:MAG: Gfo/Idh/MocA family oxidoreductase [Anaerolineae bacterium]
MSDTRKLRIGVWSLDHMHSRSYLEALRKRHDIGWVGLADERNPHVARELASRMGIAYVASAAELLDSVDAVIITSANAEHRPMALVAAEAGVHALVEKPLATDVADALAMIAAYAGSELVLATAFPCPFSPAFRALEARATAGELGDLLAINSTNRGSMPGGFFIQVERSGGGAVIDHTVHVADLLRRLTHSEPVRVYAEVGHGMYHQPWDDSGLLTIEMANGTVASLDCSWSRPRSFPTWGDVNLKVMGTRGSAEAALFGQHIVHYPAEAEPARWVSWGADLDALMIDDFVGAIRDGRAPASTGMDGLRALQVALAAYESGKLGQPSAIPSIQSLGA